MDMVNTYFRLSERREIIAENGIRLVSPNYVSTNIETLSLPAEVSSAFHMDWDTVVFDVGGDTAGAKTLGRFYGDFQALDEPAEVLNVINVRRPMSGTADKAIALMEQIEEYSRLKVTGLINNTNLAHLTSVEELRDGYEVLREVSERTGIPVAYTTGTPELLAPFLAEERDSRCIGEAVPIEILTHRDWDTFVRRGV